MEIEASKLPKLTTLSENPPLFTQRGGHVEFVSGCLFVCLFVCFLLECGGSLVALVEVMKEGKFQEFGW